MSKYLQTQNAVNLTQLYQFFVNFSFKLGGSFYFISGPFFKYIVYFSMLLVLCRYVVEKDVKNNVVFVSRNYFSFDKRRRLFRVGSLRWFSGLPPKQMHELQCKVENPYSCLHKQWYGYFFPFTSQFLYSIGQSSFSIQLVQLIEHGVLEKKFTIKYEHFLFGSGKQ